MILKIVDNIIVTAQKIFEVATVGANEGTEGSVNDVSYRHIVDVAELQQIHHLVVNLVVLAVVLLDTVAVLLCILLEKLPTTIGLVDVEGWYLGCSLRRRWNRWPFHLIKHPVNIGQVEQVVGRWRL